MTSTAERFDLTIDGSGAGTPSAPAPTAPMAPKGLNSRLSIATTERRHVPKRSGKPDPAGHLTPEEIEALGAELDALRQEILASRGARDAAYIHKVLKWQRGLEMSSRAVLLFSLFPPAWLVGTAGLSVAKILENMELGHNIMHGQWDWMRDPKIHSTEWEWDNASPAEFWKHSHNELHHTFTNVIGRDNDLGYGIMRVDEDQKWTPAYLGQPLYNFLNMCVFEYGIAAYDLELGAYVKGRGKDKETFQKDANKVVRKIGRQVRKDYLIHPLLSGPSFFHTMGANAVANLVRNVWTHSVIMCGHFPEGVETFAKDSIDGETRGEWYLRQMVGSANISGGRVIHLMSGNLSHQIEHHLFPDLPSNRYVEIAPQVRDICQRYGLSYTTGPMVKQVASAWKQVVVLALPNPQPGRTRVGIAAEEVGKRLRRKVRGSRRRPARA
jgi:linoleoyl-CoA desaturase